MKPDSAQTKTVSGDALDFAYATDVGNRANQEDYSRFARLDGIGQAAPCRDLVYVLADGIGGCAGGEIAATIAVDAFIRVLGETPDDDPNPVRMLSALKAADSAVARRKEKDGGELAAMGCTLCCAWVRGKELYFLSVGDSPIFLMRGNELIRLNIAHNVLSDRLRMAAQSGAGPAEESAIRNDPKMRQIGAMLTSYVNGQGIKQVHLPATPILMNPGDSVLVASDGILTLPLAEIAIILRDGSRYAANAKQKAGVLLQRVKEHRNPRQDNVTFGIIRVPSVVPELIDDNN